MLKEHSLMCKYINNNKYYEEKLNVNETQKQNKDVLKEEEKTSTCHSAESGLLSTSEYQFCVGSKPIMKYTHTKKNIYLKKNKPSIEWLFRM